MLSLLSMLSSVAGRARPSQERPTPDADLAFDLDPSLPDLPPLSSPIMAPPAPQQQQQPKAPDHIDTKLIDLGNGKGRACCPFPRGLFRPSSLDPSQLALTPVPCPPCPPSPLPSCLPRRRRPVLLVRSSGCCAPGILCIADIRGDIEQCVRPSFLPSAPREAPAHHTRSSLPSSTDRLNRLVRESGAVACIHTGDFGLYDRQSVDRISDK